MRVAFTFNLRREGVEADAEFDSPRTIQTITAALSGLGHEVEQVNVDRPISELAAQLEAMRPDLIFNTAEGARGRFREAFYPALFEQLGIPYAGSDAFACALTLDKAQTKQVLVDRGGICTPAWRFVEKLTDLEDCSFRFPVLAKPNFEGSSIGITSDGVAENQAQLVERAARLLALYPDGVLVEEYIEGRDLVVPFVEGVAEETHGVLEPSTYRYPSTGGFTIYDFERKFHNLPLVAEVPGDLSQRERREVMETAHRAFSILRIRDVGRIDFRLAEDGTIYFLEINALPSLEEGASIYLSAAHAGLEGPGGLLDAIVSSAVKRQSLAERAASRLH